MAVNVTEESSFVCCDTVTAYPANGFATTIVSASPVAVSAATVQSGTAKVTGTVSAVQSLVSSRKETFSPFVAAANGAVADMSIAAGNVANLGGNTENGVGDSVKKWGIDFKAAMDAAMPSGIADRLGYEDWSTDAGQFVEKATSMAYRFAPAMFGGPAVMQAILASDTVNAYSDTFDSAMDPQRGGDGNAVKANVLGSAAALINYFGGKYLMGEGKAAAGMGADMAKSVLQTAGEFLYGAAKTGTVMGLQSGANKAVENLAANRPVGQGVMQAADEGAAEGAMFHGVNAVPSMALGVKESYAASREQRRIRDEATRTVLAEEGGAEFWAGMNPNGADAIVKSLKEDGHVTRKAAREAELPDVP